MTVPMIALHDGVQIPQLGFGVFQIEPDQTHQAVTTALQVGYRHIDTAQMYGNEKEVGTAIADSDLDRSEVFVTSKLNNGFHEPAAARRALDDSLRALGIDQLDLFLVHWPLPTRYDGDFVSTWQTLLELRDADKTRSVGVSNFQVAHLERLAAQTGEAPSVNQIEVHPYLANDDVRRYCAEHHIAVEAWSPIAQGKVLDDKVLTGIADRLGRTAAQVTLRWHLQRGDIVFPKSTTPSRVEENFALFDFELTADDMAAITGLHRGEVGRTGPNPDDFDYIPD